MFGPSITDTGEFLRGGPLVDRIARHATARTGFGPPTGLMPDPMFAPIAGFDDGARSDEEVAAALDGTHTTVSKLLGTYQEEPTLDSAFAMIVGLLADGGPLNTDLIHEVFTFKQRIMARLEEQRQARVRELEAEAEKLYQQCRDASDQVERLAAERNAIQMRLNSMAESVAGSRAALQAIEQQRPPASRYPSAAEKAAWVERVNNARLAASQWNARWSAAESDLAAADSRLRIAQDEFAGLQRKEALSRERIAAGASADLKAPTLEQFDMRDLRPGETRVLHHIAIKNQLEGRR